MMEGGKGQSACRHGPVYFAELVLVAAKPMNPLRLKVRRGAAQSCKGPVVPATGVLTES